MAKIRTLHRKRRASSVEIQRRIAQAEADPNILSMGVVESMRRYKLNYQNITQLRHRVMSRKISEGDGTELIAISEQKDRSRLRARVLRAENRYHLIHRRICTESNMSDIARDYSVSRERVRQIREQFNSLREIMGASVNGVLDEIEEECGSNNNGRE